MGSPYGIRFDSNNCYVPYFDPNQTMTDIQKVSRWDPATQDIQLDQNGNISLSQKGEKPLNPEMTQAAAKRIAECLHHMLECEEYSFKQLNRTNYEGVTLDSLRFHSDWLKAIPYVWSLASQNLETYYETVQANETSQRSGWMGKLKNKFKTLDGSSSIRTALDAVIKNGMVVKDIQLNANVGSNPLLPIVELKFSNADANSKEVEKSHYFITERYHTKALAPDDGKLFNVLTVKRYKDINIEQDFQNASQKIIPIQKGPEDTAIEIIFGNVHTERMEADKKEIARQILYESKQAYAITPNHFDCNIEYSPMFPPLYKKNPFLPS